MSGPASPDHSRAGGICTLEMRDRESLLTQVHPVVFGNNLPGWECGSKELPGVLLIQEWWGLTDIVKMQAAAISQQGFRVMIPDLYTHTELAAQKGTTTASNREEAGHSMNTLDFVKATAEIGDAYKYLVSTGSARVAIVGGCMGAALAFAAAEKVEGLVGAVPFYGTIERLAGNVTSDKDGQPYFQVERIKIPVQYHTGMLDNISGFSDPQTGRQVINRMKAAGCDAELFLYENTPHSFLNELVPGGKEFLEKWDYGVPPQSQVELAFQRLIAFLHKHLYAPTTDTS